MQSIVLVRRWRAHAPPLVAGIRCRHDHQARCKLDRARAEPGSQIRRPTLMAPAQGEDHAHGRGVVAVRASLFCATPCIQGRSTAPYTMAAHQKHEVSVGTSYPHLYGGLAAHKSQEFPRIYGDGTHAFRKRELWEHEERVQGKDRARLPTQHRAPTSAAAFLQVHRVIEAGVTPARVLHIGSMT
jgi:hypothetical protein